jgi:hypothetical protein
MHCVQLGFRQFVVMLGRMVKLSIASHEFAELLSFLYDFTQMILTRNPAASDQGIQSGLDLVQRLDHFCLLRV